jgi:hypothetical protein
MKYDVSENIRAYENGKLDDAAINRLFQHLADTGQVWKLEGHYSKTDWSWPSRVALRCPTLD